MAWFVLVVGGILVAMVVHGLVKGELYVKGHTFKRSESPKLFWFLSVALFAAGLYTVFLGVEMLRL